MEAIEWFKVHGKSYAAQKARRKGAIESLKKRRAPQERLLEKALSEKNIGFHVNFPLKENLIVDFFLPDSNIVIECKEINSFSKREIKEQIQKLAFQGFKIKFNFPMIKV
ncbi:MAG: hypothetical protein ABIM02_06635 [candidate division WOR-3 bacterium]